MAEINISHFRQESDCGRTKREDNLSYSSSTLAENMREQPKATKLVHSPRMPAKNSGNSDENSKISKSLSKETKAKSDDSSSSSLSLFEGREQRKSLQVLQPSADGQRLLVGGTNSQRSKTKSKAQQKRASSSSQTKLKHYLTKSSDEVDKTQSSSSEVESTTTSVPVKSEMPPSSDDAYALMVQVPAPERYWELVAEERRKALEETLEENMKLYEMIEKLKEENAALKEKANNTDYFATMYKVTKDDVPSTQDSSRDS
ncbi:Geminin [Paramuricea clavata]|uniref:Geminin n=1 Tax=Paramuricea clavata TaxID=317549 RepID=A0A6S7HKG9_PARCT|nr:Geminin [Paramuricea clavata]